MADAKHVRKLFRVLVAGGIALAGVAGARADDPSATATQKPDQASQKASDRGGEREATTAADKTTADKTEQERAAKQQKDGKSAEQQKKAAEPEGDGVKGW